VIRLIMETRMADLVDIAIPANAHEVAQALGLVVTRSVTDGARVRRISREEAEIAVACLHDYGFASRIITASGEPQAA
jgi:hypothetical protein